MRTLNKILTGILALSLFANTFAASSEVNIESVNSLDSKQLIISLDSEIGSMGELLEGDVSVFRDLEVLNVNIIDNNNVTIELAKALEKNTSYSLVSFAGVKGDMNFDIEEELSDLTLENNSFDVNLKQITIVDDYTIQINYNEEISSKTVEIKLLKDIKINSLLVDMENRSNVIANFEKELDSLSDYILMAYAVETEDAQEYIFASPIFDFRSEDYNPEEEANEENSEEIVDEVSDESTESIPSVENTREEMIEEEVSTEDVIKNIEETLEEEIDPMMVGEIEEVALNSAETPDTGAETNVLLLLTFIATSAVFLRKKFSKA